MSPVWKKDDLGDEDLELGNTSRSGLLVLFLVASIAVPKAEGQFTIAVYTDQAVYDVGEPVRVSFETVGSGLSASVTIEVYGPMSYTFGPISITTGGIYTATIPPEATQIPGYYQVKVTLGLTMDIYTGTTSFQVIQTTPFDFELVVTPSTITIKKGETAKYSLTRTVSDPYYEDVTVRITDVQGLTSGMSWKLAGGSPATLSITTSESTPPGTYSLTIVGTAEGLTRTETVTLIVEALFDYSIVVSPSTQTVNIGKKTDYTVAVTLISGTPQLVSLSLTGLPGDLLYTFSTPSANPSFTSTLTIDASTASTTGTYTFTVTGSGGGLTRTASSAITVKEALDFTLASSTSMITVKQGEKATLTIDIQQVEGFQDVVTLTVSGLPNGATYTFNPSSGIPPFTSSLVVETSSSISVGNYSVTIHGSGGGKTHSITVGLNVEKNEYSIANLSSILTNPTYLAILIVIVAAVALGIVASKSGRGRTAAQPVKQVSHCPKCGAPVEPGVEYCITCGASVKQ